MTFDGAGISVYDLKKEIVLANDLAKSNDLDIAVYDKSSNEGAHRSSFFYRHMDRALAPELKDDQHIIRRSSSVIVKRLPAARPGRGNAATYVARSANATSDAGAKPSTPAMSGNNPSRRFDGKEEPPKHSPPKAIPVRPAFFHSSTAARFMPSRRPTLQTKLATSIAKEDEQAAIAAMFQMQTDNWEETQERMSRLVSRLAGLFTRRCGRRRHLTNACSSCPVAVLASIPTPVRLGSLVEVNRRRTVIAIAAKSRYRPVMRAIAADRKVRCYLL